MYDCMVCVWGMRPCDAMQTTLDDFWRWLNMRHPKEKHRASGTEEPWVKLDHERLLRAARAYDGNKR